MKNEKLLLDIQTKCGDIADEILNTAIDAERAFKCKWPYEQNFTTGQATNCMDIANCIPHPVSPVEANLTNTCCL